MAALEQFLLDALQQILRPLVLDREIHIPSDAEGEELLQFAPGKEQAEIVHNQLFQQYERASGLIVGHFDKTRQPFRHLDKGVHQLAPVRRTHAHGDFDRTGVQNRERVRLIHRQRRQHRQHLQPEIPGEFRADRGGEFRRFAQPDAVRLQRRKNVVAERPALPFQQPIQFSPGGGKLFGGAVSGRVRQILIHLDQLAEPGDAHHEELIEIAAEDGDELQPFQQRIGRGERFIQYPGVEIDPAQFPADEELLVRSLLPGFRHFFLFHIDSGASSIFRSKPNT